MHEDMHARLLKIGEAIPDDLNIQFPWIDPMWTWVVEADGTIIAVLIAAPGPGIAILIKLSASPQAPANAQLRLLRRALRDMYNRGFEAYMACLDSSRPFEGKLTAISIKAGGLVMGQGLIMGGSTNIRRW